MTTQPGLIPDVEDLWLAGLDAHPLAALMAEPHWCSWRPVPNGNGKPRKKPDIDPDVPWLPHQPQHNAFHVTRLARRNAFDLDNCRDPETGEIDPRALDLIEQCGAAYVEESPSGTGFKVIGARDDTPRFLQVNFASSPMVVTDISKNYSAITFCGQGDPDADISGAIDFYAALIGTGGDGRTQAPTGPVGPGNQHDALVAEAGSLRRRGHDDRATFVMLRAWAHERFHPKPSDHDIEEIVRSTAGWAVTDQDFTRDQHGKPLKTQTNIRLALQKLGVRLAEDQFARALTYEYGDRGGRIDDAFVAHLWLLIDQQFGLLSNRLLFDTVVDDLARQHPYHPVRDHLAALTWDGAPRLDRWLAAYGAAEDTEYVRAVGALVLIAAVRRVRQPGCKFDELLILESGQGLNKSSALRALCPNEGWFSDSLALGADAKKTIEGTAGVWIVEASDLQGKNKRDIEELKASLSRQVDGPVRLAYGRRAETVPRQFIVVGTTNRSAYLIDSTGNRRFWPVQVGCFDLTALRRDRDQLWAEAAHREALGESIRLRRELWPVAAEEQEARRVEDPWEELLEEHLRDKDKVPSDEVWGVVGVSKDRREQEHNVRLGAVMKRLGFKRGMARFGTPKLVRAYSRLAPRPGQLALEDDRA